MFRGTWSRARGGEASEPEGLEPTGQNRRALAAFSWRIV